MTPLSDDELRGRLRTDPDSGWRAFIDQYTPLIVGLIRRAGVVDRDEVMEVYVLLCEQLSARGFERLRRQDAARGSIGGWLAVVARHAVVDWVRSRRGRRRLFQAVDDLPAADQRIFELFHWHNRTPSEIAEMLPLETGAPHDLGSVLDALARIDARLTQRHRADLLALAARAATAVPIDDADVADRLSDPQADPELTARISDLNARLDTALARLPPEDAAIVRLKFIEGLTNRGIERAIGISALTTARVQDILSRLRALLLELGVEPGDVAHADRLSLDRSTT